ncbi:MAG: energy-coupling factor transporter ATPase [Eubacteriales bacterium]|nr:energy-coupling factor transporter ATPase [Eubacteriales bacterium]
MAIELKGVSYAYNPGTVMAVRALVDINLRIEEKSFIAIIGHTGCGKSTLMQHLNGLIRPLEGTVTFEGEDIHAKGFDKRTLRSEVGLVFQYPEYQLFEETVFKDVAFGPKNMGLEEAEIRERVIEALTLVNMGEAYYEKSPFLLSGGEKRRVAIAGVLAMRPRYLILDEPAAGLDPVGRRNILKGIRRLNQSLGMTIIMVSHSMEDVAMYADRIVVMNDGKIVYDDVPADVFSHDEDLEAMGLSVPVMTKVLLGLKRRGWDVRTDCHDMASAKAEILKAVAR